MELSMTLTPSESNRRHYLRQIQSLSQQTNAELQNKIQQCEVARVGFVRMLKEDLTLDGRRTGCR